jgi:hypothetical protein
MELLFNQQSIWPGHRKMAPLCRRQFPCQYFFDKGNPPLDLCDSFLRVLLRFNPRQLLEETQIQFPHVHLLLPSSPVPYLLQLPEVKNQVFEHAFFFEHLHRFVPVWNKAACIDSPHY